MMNTFRSMVSRFQIAKRAVAALAAFTFAAITPLQALAQQADPYSFEKKAYKPDGTPWSGPVNVGDTVKYVLSYKPGTTNSGPVTIDDTLSPNLGYAGPVTSSPGWTWGSSPYATGNMETYAHPGFGPGGGSVTLAVSGVPSPPTGQVGDGTIPIPVLSEGKVFGIYHHSNAGNSLIDCWDLNTLAKCGAPKNNSLSGPISTIMTPKAVIRGTKFYFPGHKAGSAVIGCFDGATNSACTEIVVPAAVADYSEIGGLVEDGAGRFFIAVKEKVFCYEGASPAPCTAWVSTSITTNVSPSSTSSPAGTEDFVNMLAEHSSSPTRIYIHHGDSVVQCLDTATGTPCSGGAWTTAGISLGGSGSMLSSIPLSGSSGDGGVCLWTHYGAQVGCISNTGTPVTISHPAFSHPTIVPISSMRIPGTGKVYFPDYFDNGPECIEYSGTTGVVCSGYPMAWPSPYSDAGGGGLDKATQYGFALDPKDPQNCMLALGHNNMLWRFDYNTGKIGCGSSASVTPPIDSLYCSGKPDPTKFKWTGLNVATSGASGTLTIMQGSTTIYTGPPTPGYMPFSSPAFGAGPLTVIFVPGNGSPTTINVQVTYESDRNPDICYSATVKKCGPVSNTATMKATLNAAALSVAKKVDLGIAAGPECDPKPPVDVSCLSGDVKVTCGKAPGTFIITLNATGAGGVTPDSVSIFPNTAGVSIVNPQAAYPVINGQVKFTVTGANPGDSLSFDMEGTKHGAGAVKGSDLCCNGSIKVDIPKELDCKDRMPIDVAIKKTGATTPEPSVGAYTFALALTNEGAAFTPAPGDLTVTDTVPAGVTFTSITGSAGWTCIPAASAAAGTPITCTFAGGALAAGPAAPIGTINIVASATGAAPFPPVKNCADIGTAPAAPVSDSKLSNNHSCVTVTKPPVGEPSSVSLLKTCEPPTEVDTPKGIVFEAKCKIKVTSTGNVSTPVSVTEGLTAPGGSITAVANSPATDLWGCTPTVPNAGPLTCVLPANTLTGPTDMSEINVTVQFDMSAMEAGAKNCAELTGGTRPDDKSCVVIMPENPPKTYDLSIDKSWTAGATPFDGKFTIAVKNEAATAVASPDVIKFSDYLPVGLTISSLDASSSPDWTCTALPVSGPNPITCKYTGTMPVAPGVVLPSVVWNATIAPSSFSSSEPVVVSNCATTGVYQSANAFSPEDDSIPANNKDCVPTSTFTANCMMTGTCTPPPPLTCQSDVLLVVDRSKSILDPGTVKSALTNFLAPMQGKGGKVEVLYFSSKNYPAPNATVTVVPQTTLGSVTVPPLSTPSGGYTNWDNALQVTSTLTTTPKYVIFITDGEPTAYDSSPGVEVAPSASVILAANEAAPWINAIRMGGSRLQVIGFGTVAGMGYLEATFGGTVGDGQSADIIKVNNETGLYNLMTKLGRQLCGTLNLSKSSSGSLSHQFVQNEATFALAGDITFGLTLTNNSSAPITGISVEDEFSTAIQAGMPSDAAFTAPVTAGTPSHGAISVATAGTTHTITWGNFSLNPGETAYASFKTHYSGTHPNPGVHTSWKYPNVAQVKTSVGDGYSTPGNIANYTQPSVVEVDEAYAAAFITVSPYSPPVNPCAGPNKQASCYFSAEKQFTSPGIEGECVAGGKCHYTMAVSILSQHMPAGASVKITDTFTVNGSAASWTPTTVVENTTTCTGLNSSPVCQPVVTGTSNCASPPAGLGFVCTAPVPAPGTDISTMLTFNVETTIPAGTTGEVKNCFDAEIVDPSGTSANGVHAPGNNIIYGPSYNQLCATLTIASPNKVAQKGSLIVEKDALFNGEHIVGPKFPIRVTCGDAVTGLSIVDGAPEIISDIPFGTSCAVLEGEIPAPANQCSEKAEPIWTTIYSPSAPVLIGAPETRIKVTNQLSCKPIEVSTPLACDPATATQAGDLCRCRFDNMSPVSKTACECKDGFTLKAGQGCVRKVVEPKCDPATTIAKGGKCLCEYKNMVQTSATACACAKGFKFAPGKGCFKPEPVCRKGGRFEPKRGRCEPVCAKGFDYNLKRNACIQRPPVCGKGTVFNPKRNRCDPVQPVCRKPFVFDPKRNACVEVIKRCEPGTIPFKGRCIPVPKCPRGQIPVPGTPLCVSIGGGGGDRPKEGCIPSAVRACD